MAHVLYVGSRPCTTHTSTVRGMARAQAGRTTCPKGHPYDLISGGRRRCRRCARERWAERHPRRTLAEYLWARIVRTPEGCWRWTGSHATTGYGTGSFEGRAFLAHREVYEVLVGPIPEALTVDHVHDRGCRWKDCVNPSHLEPVTLAENVRRAAAARRAAHCPHGHPFDAENTGRTGNGWRYCLTCNRTRSAAAYSRSRSEGAR